MNENLYISLNKAMGNETPYPIEDVLKCLSEASKHLLGRYGYDAHGHEKIQYCIEHAKDRIKDFEGIREIMCRQVIPNTGRFVTEEAKLEDTSNEQS